MSARNVQRRLEFALTAGYQWDLASGDTLSFLPQVNDQGSIEIGDGSTDMDLKVFLGSTSEYVEFDVGNSRVNCEVPILYGSNGGPQFNHAAKTSNYTVTSSDFGSVLSTTGATGAVTFTLPDAASANAGAWVLFVNTVDQDMTVKSNTADDLIVFNDTAADSIAFSTASEKTGGMFLAVCNGTKWTVAPIATETQSVTIATA